MCNFAPNDKQPMNKQDWTYKKLGEVCEIYQPKTLSSNMLSPDGKYAVYGANGIIGRYNKFNHEYSEVLMTCRGATCGTINVSEPFSWINGNAMVIHPKNDDITKTFLVYVLRGIDLSDVITGAAQPQITRQSLSPKKLPIPPLAEQERIVAELDLLSSIIEQKKAQLKEYDQLAQSIFYDMFGDPEQNPFGFSTFPLRKLCLLKAGKAVKANELSENQDNRYPCYGGNGIRGYIDSYSHNGIYPIIGRQGALCGNINLAQGQFYATEHAVVVSPLKSMNAFWLYYALQFMHLEQYAHGVAQPGLSVKDLNPLILYYPPLNKQQQFAEKIEAIEKHKALVQASIAETETLFNSRMDYYFN